MNNSSCADTDSQAVEVTIRASVALLVGIFSPGRVTMASGASTSSCKGWRGSTRASLFDISNPYTQWNCRVRVVPYRGRGSWIMWYYHFVSTAPPCQHTSQVSIFDICRRSLATYAYFDLGARPEGLRVPLRRAVRFFEGF